MGLKVAGAGRFAPKTEMVQLPSLVGTGEAVKLKRPDLVELFTGDDIPDVLSNIVLDTIGVNGKKNKKQEDFVITKDNLPQLMKVLDIICVACFVEPRVTTDEAIANMNPDEWVYVGWLDFVDKTAVMDWALGAQFAKVESFREEATGDVETVPEMQDVQPLTE